MLSLNSNPSRSAQEQRSEILSDKALPNYTPNCDESKFPTSSTHFGMYKAIFRLLELAYQNPLKLNNNLPSLPNLSTMISGTGVYIGPENKNLTEGFGPHPLSAVIELRDKLLTHTQRLFPDAQSLKILGPEYESGYSRQAGTLNTNLGVYWGLDSSWPQELIDQKISWGICLNLWDESYYLSPLSDAKQTSKSYDLVARNLFNNMAEQATLIVTTLMSGTVQFDLFAQSFEKAGWKIVAINEQGQDPMLLVKGLN